MRILKRAVRPLRGELVVPGDKSISHRSLMLGALTRDGLTISHLSNGEDVRSTRRCLEALGVSIIEKSGVIVVKGHGGRQPLAAPSQALDCGNSGTTMRLMSGLLAGQPFESQLIGDASLSRRPMKRVAEPLSLMGAEINLTPTGCAPMLIRGQKPLRAVTYRLPVPSAQVKSAVLLAGLFSEGTVTVEDPFLSRDHTERMLSWLSNGKAVQVQGECISVHAAPLIGGSALTVPGDISSAAFWLGATLLVAGSEVIVQGVGLNPTRAGFLEVLREMGARIEILNPREEAGEPVGDIKASYSSLCAIDLSPEKIPSLVDEVPLLAVLAATAKGKTRLAGLGELRLKESDRLEGIAAGLRSLGAEIEIEGDSLLIQGPTRFHGAALKTLKDHRLAMSFAVAALAAEGEVSIDDDACVAISYPGFFKTLEDLL